ncbi:mitotic spindle checkpoint protein Bub3 [Chytridiales sp. JEL 0842]|nr:mitotic spindle checkpoint protein Bub3 [Chytridiales sp. JEL 0842]
MDYELLDPPSDGISTVAFAPEDSAHLLVSSWDNSVSLYDIHNNQRRYKYTHKAAVLDAAFVSNTQAVSAGLDKDLKLVDLHTTTEKTLGSHSDAIRVVLHNPGTQNIITGSWDRSIKLWDPRTSSNPEVGQYPQPNKIFSMDVAHNKLVVAMAGRLVYIYDLRNMTETLQKRESSLKFMTRSVKCMPNGEGYASSSIEGRIAVEFFDPSEESQARKYAFKCHREKLDGGSENIYPVNALAFHPIHGTFASGGADGVVSVWDGFNKKRIKQYPKFPTGIASLAFSHDGQYMAVASSYTYEEGEKDHPADQVFIRQLTEVETKPKVVAPAQ